MQCATPVLASENTYWLGNVNVVISDKKIGIDAGLPIIKPVGGVDYYQADVVSVTGYMPFGMEMVGRTASVGPLYKFGFNGQLEVDEISGDGNHINYKFRGYDTRLGRMWGVDPITAQYPELTPYQHSSLNPIWKIELEGLEGVPSTEKEDGSGYTTGQAHASEVDGSALNKQFQVGQQQQGSQAASDRQYRQQFGNGPRAEGSPQYGSVRPYNITEQMPRSVVDLAKAGQEGLMGAASEVAVLRVGANVAKFAQGVKALKAVNRPSSAYDGVRVAAKYLQNAGVPRQYRKQILQSFEIETISMKAAGDNTFGLRFFDDVNAFAKGRYLFPNFGNSVNRVGLALPPKWNMMTSFKQWQIAPGSQYVFGRTASQGGRFTGGNYQMYVNDLSNLMD